MLVVSCQFDFLLYLRLSWISFSGLFSYWSSSVWELWNLFVCSLSLRILCIADLVVMNFLVYYYHRKLYFSLKLETELDWVILAGSSFLSEPGMSNSRSSLILRSELINQKWGLLVCLWMWPDVSLLWLLIFLSYFLC